jgi:hypothetical protein
MAHNSSEIVTAAPRNQSIQHLSTYPRHTFDFPIKTAFDILLTTPQFKDLVTTKCSEGIELIIEKVQSKV